MFPQELQQSNIGYPMDLETAHMLHNLGFDVSKGYTPITMWLDDTTNTLYAKQGNRTRIIPSPESL